ncbi:MAG: tRNA (N6-isopentenyl adenosine(37)-C2)-methylthiotransferase MiaB [Pseudobacteriovorax sp.]|nr:tRNA (N6-isopentenyl adenosine(37)-C2)-methylthiotransferase MiaB [Pseudobacteriovorax sp.]
MTTISNVTEKQKVLVETWGCQMNVADSENMLEMLEGENYVLTNDAEDADLVLLNTCHIREKATHKVLSRLGRLRETAKNHNPNMKIAVAGCVAQAEGKKLMDQAKNIDILVGPGKISELPELISKNKTTGKRQLSVGFRDPETKKINKTYSQSTTAKPAIAGKTEISRYVNIAQGCNNFCTFCVVPFTRGREISRTIREIVSETSNLVASGAKEITLLGQNVNSYGLDLLQGSTEEGSLREPFVDLLYQVADVPGLERLRFTTSNPHDFSPSIATAFSDLPKLGKYIHLPVQSGNDVVLERMKRKVTVAEYWERIDWLRKAVPEMAFSTDLIVGFPGETDEQFADTLSLVEKLRYSFIYAFKYSPRSGTAAARFTDQVPEEAKTERLNALNLLQDRITIEQNQNEIGNHREVLFHYESKKEPGVFYGRTEQFRLLRAQSESDLVGKTMNVRVTEANKTALVGDLIP